MSSKETQLSILQLELKKRQKICAACERKLHKYERANERVYNTISQDEIDEVTLELDTQKIEIEILKTKIKELS